MNNRPIDYLQPLNTEDRYRLAAPDAPPRFAAALERYVAAQALADTTYDAVTQAEAELSEARRSGESAAAAELGEKARAARITHTDAITELDGARYAIEDLRFHRDPAAPAWLARHLTEVDRADAEVDRIIREQLFPVLEARAWKSGVALFIAERMLGGSQREPLRDGEPVDELIRLIRTWQRGLAGNPALATMHRLAEGELEPEPSQEEAKAARRARREAFGRPGED